MRKAMRIAALFTALTLVGSACADDGGGGTAAAAFKIGALLPLTGDLGDFGPASVEAVRLAAAQFEKAAKEAGLNVNIDVTVEDDGTDARAGSEGARKLVDTDKVKLIIGPMASSVVLPVAESVTIPGKVTTITPSATSGKITTLVDDGFINRTPPSDEYQAPILADLVAQNVPEGSTISLGARNDPYGAFILNGAPEAKLNGVKQELQKRGYKTTGPVLWDPKATTFDSEAAKIVAGSPAAWVLVDFPATWQKVSAALVRTGKWDPAKTFSADGLKVSKLPQAPPAGSGAEATEGMRGSAPGGAGAQAFEDLWDAQVRKPKNVEPETYATHSFDATLLGLLATLRAAVTAAGSADATAVSNAFPNVTSEQLKDNLQAVSRDGTAFSWDQLTDAIKAVVAGEDIDYEGASGPVNFDKDGNVESVGANFDLYVFKDGKMTVTSTAKATAL